LIFVAKAAFERRISVCAAPISRDRKQSLTAIERLRFVPLVIDNDA